MSNLPQQTNGYAQLAADVLTRAKQCGATEADIVVADGETFSVQVRVGVVDRLSKARENGWGCGVCREAVGDDLDLGFFDRIVASTGR
jgi:PmbA protein